MTALPSNWAGRLRLQPEKRFRGSHALVVKDAPEPSDIMFENLQYTRMQRWGPGAGRRGRCRGGWGPGGGGGLGV